jgi:hypothetical protein
MKKNADLTIFFYIENQNISFDICKYTYIYRGCIGTIVAPFISQAKRHHRLALCLVATYGRTLCKAAENQQVCIFVIM